MLATGCAGLLVVLTIKWLMNLYRALRYTRYYPGPRTLLPTSGLWSVFVPWPISLTRRGVKKSWLNGYEKYEEFGTEIMATVSFFPSPHVVISVADAVVVKEVTTRRSRFPKPVAQHQPLNVFGPNIVSSESDEWRKYRKASAPAFSESNNRLVWATTVRIMADLFDNFWGIRREIAVDHTQDVTLPMSLYVIASAGFGMQFGWQDEKTMPPSHAMTFKNALHAATDGLFVKALTPTWLLKLAPTGWLREVKLAYEELETYMTELVQSRSKMTDKDDPKHDLFSNLLSANEKALDGSGRLADNELMGNIFTLLLAGHETTAQTLSFALGLLALHPDFQECLYEHITEVVSDGGVPLYEDMKRLTLCRAMIYETLRMCPIVPGISKVSAEDTVLVSSCVSGHKVTIPIPQGTHITVDVVGLHYNPRYWDDPLTFRPERFLGEWPVEAFLPFSGGPRACLGRRFFETEAIAFLALLLSRYKVELQHEAKYAGETFEERKTRILQAKRGVTMTPVRIPLIFIKR